MEAQDKIQTLKGYLLRNSFQYGWNNASKRDADDESQTIIDYVKTGNFGFASEIATTVLTYKRISEKQAYWISKTAIENNLDTRINYIYNDENL